jgi:hypothetical protein
MTPYCWNLDRHLDDRLAAVLSVDGPHWDVPGLRYGRHETRHQAGSRDCRPGAGVCSGHIMGPEVVRNVLGRYRQYARQ